MTTITVGVYRSRQHRHTVVVGTVEKRRRAGGKLVPYTVIHHVPMQEGMLGVSQTEAQEFAGEFSPIQYPLHKAADHLMYRHAGGISDAAVERLLGVL